MESKIDSKVCGVCGDKALGYNFNAVTCESCKAFFRRNALAKKDFRCHFNKQCEITTVTRRFCQRCRLEKCFAIGMRKDYIMSEEDKVLKRQKIEENRARKRAGSTRFKKGFKKIKRESIHDDTSQDEGSLCTDSDNSAETILGSNYGHMNGIGISVINYTSEIGSVKGEESNSLINESLASSEEVFVSSPQNDASMIRTMLNPTPNGSVQSGEEGSPCPLVVSFINNNETNCNHNVARQVGNATDVTKDVLEDVQR